MVIKELLEKRAKLVADARAIYDLAEKEKREPSAEERKQFDKMMDDAQKLKVDADKKQEDLESRNRLEDAEKDLETSRGRLTAQDTGKKGETEVRKITFENRLKGFNQEVSLSGPLTTPEYEAGFRNYLRRTSMTDAGSEKRALQKDSDTAGGYLSAPLVWMAELIKAVDNLTFMRQISRVLPPLLTSESVGAPSLDNDPADPAWTAEVAIGAEDSTMSFGARELTPRPLAQFIKVSKTLLRSSTISADTVVRDRLAYKLAVVAENAFLNGTGAAGQPLGVFTASDLGIGTARDVSTGNTSATPTFDGLKEAKWTLKNQYRSRANWIFHRTIVKLIDKLKDGEGRYIWQASVIPGAPDTILGVPVRESEYAPNTISGGVYVGMIGDFSNYWIVDSLNATIQVLVELYAATNQNGYLSRVEFDAMPVLAEAFIRVKLGS